MCLLRCIWYMCSVHQIPLNASRVNVVEWFLGRMRDEQVQRAFRRLLDASPGTQDPTGVSDQLGRLTRKEAVPSMFFVNPPIINELLGAIRTLHPSFV